MRTVIFVGSAFAVVLWAGCLKNSAFNCADDTACGAGGFCEPEGFCSVSNSACDSGRAFSDTAGNGLAGQCVGGGTPIDAPIDPPTDADPPIDTPQAQCEGYAAIAGGTAGHLYKFVDTPARNHSTAHNLGCLVTPGAYLAIPNEPGELAAYFTLTGGAAWVGFDEPGNENVFVDILNQPFDIVTAGITIVDNKMNEDCALMVSATGVDMEPCGDNRSAVCECEP